MNSKSNHLVDELLSKRFCGNSAGGPGGLDPPGFVAVAPPAHATTALLFLNLRSATCTYPSLPTPPLIAVILHLKYWYV